VLEFIVEAADPVLFELTRKRRRASVMWTLHSILLSARAMLLDAQMV
jgi:hypothetical protein